VLVPFGLLYFVYKNFFQSPPPLCFLASLPSLGPMRLIPR
jgi:hypothetical protein